MGRIAEQVADAPPATIKRRPNKLDRIIDTLDADDNALVLGWLHDLDGCPEEWIEARLLDAGIECSDSTIRRWRRANGITWGA